LTLWKKALLGALCITLIQIALLLSMHPSDSLLVQYHRLYQWDSYHYGRIAIEGYFARSFDGRFYQESNVAFFPGYPLWIRFFQFLSQIRDVRIAAAIAAQICAVIFWNYFLLILLEWKLPISLITFGVAWIICHPASFFLVAPYSESLFLAALLGFLYWDRRSGKIAFAMTLLHGFIATGTRIVGALCTVVHAGFNILMAHSKIKRGLIVGLITSLGAFSFFLFAYLKWGTWTLYFDNEKKGWGVVPDYLAFLKPALYTPFVPNWRDPNQLSQISVPITVYSFSILIFAELYYRKLNKNNWKHMVQFYSCALPMIYITICGRMSVNFMSMIRYHFPIHVVLILPLLYSVHERGIHERGIKWFLRIASTVLILLFLYMQLELASLYVRGFWVA
jgi:hypothetical protein